jgi:hypothetical protein
MFLQYANETGRSKGVVYDKRGVAVGVTDAVKQAFVDDVTTWARTTNDEIQASAIGAKAMDNPASALPLSGEPGPAPGGGGATAQERPTMPVPAPAEDVSGPATRKDGAGQEQPAQTGTGPIKGGPGAEGVAIKVEDIPGGISVKKDERSIVVSAAKDPKTFVRLEVVGNSLRLTDIFRKDTMPAGAATVLLAEALKESRAARGNELIIVSIQNPETLATFEARLSASESKLGRVAARGLEQGGYSAGQMHWDHIDGKLAIAIEIR